MSPPRSRIPAPGKFEGEPLYTPHFYGLWLNGIYDASLQVDGREITVFELNPVDVAKFPELAGQRYLLLWEDDNGFVYCKAGNELPEEDADTEQEEDS